MAGVVAPGWRRLCQLAFQQQQEPAEHLPANPHGHRELAREALDLPAELLPDVGELHPVAEPGRGVKRPGGQDPVGTEQVRHAPVVCRQVPDARLADQAVRVEGVGAHRAVAAVPVAQLHPAAAEGRLLQHFQVLGRLGGPAPAHRVDEDPPAGEFRAGPLLVGQRRHQLAQRGPDRVPETQSEVGAGRAGQQHQQRTGLLGGQPGDVGAVARHQGDPAERAADRVDRDSRRRQPFHISHDRPHRDAQPAGELSGGQLSARLEQQHDGYQPVRSHGSKILSHT